MFATFEDFYQLVKGTPLSWAALQETLRIKQESYPQNQDIFNYYLNTFKGKTSSFGRSKWHSMDKLLCIWVVAKYCQLEDKNKLALEKADFRILARLLGVHSQLLQFKWLKLIKPYLKNRPWSEEEDGMIRELMESKLSKKWTEIALKLSENNVSSGLRTAKQVRQRWINYLDPEIKRDEWTAEDDEELLRLIQKNGKKWSVLGKQLKRTQNCIKNRFHSMMGRLKSSDDLGEEDMDEQQSVQSGTKIQQIPPLKQEQFCSSIVGPKMATFKLLQAKVCKYRTIQPYQIQG